MATVNHTQKIVSKICNENNSVKAKICEVGTCAVQVTNTCALELISVLHWLFVKCVCPSLHGLK